MNPWPFIIASYALPIGGLGVYAAVVLRRGRQLTKQVAPERRRFFG